MNGKGDKQRPTNKAKYDANYDRIFGTTPERAIQQHHEEDVVKAYWRKTDEIPINWGNKVYQQMYNSLTGEYRYYNKIDEVFEDAVDFT